MITRENILHIERLRKSGQTNMKKPSTVAQIVGLNVDEVCTIYEHYKDAWDWASCEREMSLDNYLDEVECARKI